MTRAKPLLTVAIALMTTVAAQAGNDWFPVYATTLPNPHEIKFEGRTFDKGDVAAITGHVTVPQERPEIALPNVMTRIAKLNSDIDLRMDDAGEVMAMVMRTDVMFEVGTDNLTPSALKSLAAFVRNLNEIQTLEIRGHTDNSGSPADNIDLGLRRAEMVRDWIVAISDLSEEAVLARGIGDADPMVPKLASAGVDTPFGQAQNRRMEFVATSYSDHNIQTAVNF